MYAEPTTVTLHLRAKTGPWDEHRHRRDNRGRFAEHAGTAPAVLPGTRSDSQHVPDAELLGSRHRSAGKVKAAMCGSLAQRMGAVTDEQLLSDRQRDRLTRVRAGQLAAYRPESGANGYADYVDQADLDSGTRREPWGYVRMTGDEYRDFARAEAVSHLVAGWASTANDHDPNALALQETARRRFNLADTMPWDHGHEELEAETQQVLAEDGPILDAFLTAMWETTQEHFATLGVDHVTVHRGFTGDYDDSRTSEIDGTGTVTDLPLRPLSSFSTENHMAEEFATQGGDVSGYVMSGDVPVTRILAVPGTGIGCLEENEIVVLAGPGEWHVYEVYPDETDDYFD
ncbi:hypothetical protein OG871_27385 [Kitasatospora sp. NBC_00374]|uniref:hypothetical protein n=1 Tax=Kitasatospora sp. NBC_00374 TaxID=2975964 RepID=UPI0030E29179